MIDEYFNISNSSRYFLKAFIFIVESIAGIPPLSHLHPAPAPTSGLHYTIVSVLIIGYFF